MYPDALHFSSHISKVPGTSSVSMSLVRKWLSNVLSLLLNKFSYYETDLMIVYALIGGVTAYATVKEAQQLGCKDLFTDCDNENGKVCKGTAPLPSDTPLQLLEKIDYAADAPARQVEWRKALIIAVLAVLVVWLCIFFEIPSEREMLIAIVVFTFAIYFCANFYRFHMYDIITKNIHKSVSMLRH